MKALLFLLITSLTACQVQSNDTVFEQDYEIATMTKNGIDCNFYFHYTTSYDSQINQTKINQINRRLGEELRVVADEYAIFELVNAIDSIGPRIEFEIKDELDLRDLKVLEIGVQGYIKEYLAKLKVNVERVKEINTDEITNFASETNIHSQEESKSASLPLELKTKYDSEVQIEFAIYYRKQQSESIPKNTLNQQIKNAIVDSLRKYDMYEMWAVKRDSMEMKMVEIIKSTYPETNRVLILMVEIPEDAQKQFNEISDSKHAIMKVISEIYESEKLLKQKLDSNKDLSKSKIKKLEKEIQKLKSERVLVLEKAKLITNDYKL